MSTKPTSKPNKHNWAWIWLAYTGFLFIDPIMEPSRALWIGTLVSFATFLAIMAGYIRATDEGKPLRFWMIAATFVLGLATFPWNQGASTFFVYTAAFLPFTFASVRRVLWLFLLEALIIFAEGSFFSTHIRHGHFHVGWPNTLIAIFLMTVVGGGNIFFAEQKRSECRLREAQEQNHALAAIAERERIARDLHDVLGHTLSVIVLKAELAGRLLTGPTLDPARAATEITDVERIARTALAEVREAIGGYRARGLAAEIEAARRTLDSAGVSLIAESALNSASLSAQEETVLALALREAVTNIVRHARATTCTLLFVADAGTRRLVVEDNGHAPQTPPHEGNGLRGMRERIESIGGHLRLENENGTRLLITLPQTTAAIS